MEGTVGLHETNTNASKIHIFAHAYSNLLCFCVYIIVVYSSLVFCAFTVFSAIFSVVFVADGVVFVLLK